MSVLTDQPDLNCGIQFLPRPPSENVNLMEQQLRPIHTAFVMEQALGHVTHYRNLREVADRQPDVQPVWLPIPFDVRGPARLVPASSNTWSVRASWRARRALTLRERAASWTRSSFTHR